MRMLTVALACVPGVAAAGGDQSAATFEGAVGLPLFACGLATAVGNGLAIGRGERSEAWGWAGVATGVLGVVWGAFVFPSFSDPRGDPALHYGLAGGHALLGAVDLGLGIANLRQSGGGKRTLTMALAVRW